ncbi:hypothetical protein [Streptomyces sp. NPDC047108]|uniref:hypothetical protein n=1 Tax=Streptomyces sp. NPDC047108 TaxID=3155025 RepID=UPI0033F207CA
METRDTRGLLDQAEELRKRARADRRASSVPLIALGVIILLSAPFTYGAGVDEVLYWYVAAPLGFVAIALWYRRRRTRTGVGSGRGAYGVAALCLVPGTLLAYLALAYWYVAAPLGFVAVALWYRRRRTRTGVGSGRGAYGVAAYGVAALCLISVLPLANLVLAVLTPSGHSQLRIGPMGAITLALLALALLQRNGFLAVCVAALGVVSWMEDVYLVGPGGWVNEIMEKIVTPPEPFYDGTIDWVPVLVRGLLGLLVLTAGLVALHKERAEG